MLFNPDDLFKSIVPPAGVEDDTPVLARTHDQFVNSLRALSSWFGLMANIAEKSPWADGLIDDLDRLAFDQIETAKGALTRFRLTRDCGGEA